MPGLSSNLARYGIKATIVDDRADKTSTGRADGLQPKTIETFRQLRLADSLLRKGVKIYDICFWVRYLDIPCSWFFIQDNVMGGRNFARSSSVLTKFASGLLQTSTATKPLHRTRREVHYPSQVDVKDPFILLVHQGMVEDIFIKDMRERGIEVVRNSPCVRYTMAENDPAAAAPITVICDDKTSTAGSQRTFKTRYLVGCDGAHSAVRRSIPGAQMVGESSNSQWGVLDGRCKALGGPVFVLELTEAPV